MDFEKDNLFIEEWEEDDRPSKEDRILAMMCYAHFLFLAPLFMQKDTDFLDFHMKQWGIMYWLFIVAVMATSTLLVITWSYRFVWLTWIILMIYTFASIFLWYKAYHGKMYEIWLLSPLIIWVWELIEKHRER